MDIPALIQPSGGSQPFSDSDITRPNGASVSLTSPPATLQPVGEGHSTVLSCSLSCSLTLQYLMNNLVKTLQSWRHYLVFNCVFLSFFPFLVSFAKCETRISPVSSCFIFTVTIFQGCTALCLVVNRINSVWHSNICKN